MLFLLAIFAMGAMVAPIIMRRGRMGFLVLSLIPAAAFVALAANGRAVLAGDFPNETWAWVPQLGLEVSFRLDHLAWVMSLIVTGVGAIVLAYSARYFSAAAKGLGRFSGVFLAFAGAMLGLVTTDNTLALYLFWELTTVFSFLLIGHNFDKSSSRRAAMQAIIVTTAGGLAMLVGIIILGQIPGGSYEISELIAAAQDGSLGIASLETQNVPQGLITTAVVLLLVGAFSKSALIPFHFWLPAAMAAPTPVSAYLHSSAMVKAGVFLVARFAPAFSDNQWWRIMVIVAGIGTLLVGGYRALKQYDLKLVLAFGTVSQLGLITLMVGYGTQAMLLAGLGMLVAHALFKSTLFLTIGQIDWATGTRDLRKLSGLYKIMPLTAGAAALASLSMAGFPGTAGFVAKEAALHALIGGDTVDTITWIAIAAGSALTVAYTLRFYWGAFAPKDGVEPIETKGRSWIMTVPIVTLALGALVFGLGAHWLDVVFQPHAQKIPGEPGHLVAWPGFGIPFWVTVVILVVGVLIFAVREPWVRFAEKIEIGISAESTYRGMVNGLESLSGVTTAFTQRGSLPAYLTTIFSFTLLTVVVAIVLGDVDTIGGLRPFDDVAQLLVVIVTCAAAILGARARHRIKAVVLLGVAGYGVALTYELYGAPDLALTQTLTETMTLVVYILVLRRLPAYFSNRPLKISRYMRMLLAGLSGAAVAGMAWLAAGARVAQPISDAFHDEAYAYGYGKNIVNVTLVDIRAWDTMGEISVIVACGIGISSLLFIRDRGGRVDRLRNIALPSKTPRSAVWQRPGESRHENAGWNSPQARKIESTVRAPGRNRVWLAGTETLAAQRRSVILEIGVRIIFHTVVVISIFLLFSGHNQPGGGFAGGLLAGIALVMRYLAGGRYELGAAVPLHPGHLMGAGLTIATVAALIPIPLGGTILQTAKIDLTLPGFGDVHIATAMFFDVGVYLVVVGMILDILRSLGAEIDRHGELEGMDDDDSLPVVPADDARRAAVDSEAARVQHDIDLSLSDDVEPTGSAREPVPASASVAVSERVPGEPRPEDTETEPMDDPAVTSEMSIRPTRNDEEVPEPTGTPEPDPDYEEPERAIAGTTDPETGITTIAIDPETTSNAADERRED